jgi:asparagine synthase (glutamine-hydrolysing)
LEKSLTPNGEIVCGITGIITSSEEAAKYFNAIKSATLALHHRGPDSYGSFADFNALLGHTRLSIIDTSQASDQPFYSADGRFVIVYNGEIFNFRELRETLVKKGVAFKTSGDTEVLLQLYINEGEKFLDKINGFFAFAIYDNLQKSLFIARDRFGIKPLFYYWDGSRFIFASEMKALLEYPFERIIDHVSLIEYLQLNYIPAPNTMLEGVKKFPVGQWSKIIYNDRKLKFTPFCNEPYFEGCEDKNISYDSAVKKFYNLLEDSVQKRLIADVPLGTFLSGGLDSSAITAMAALHKKNIMSFSIGYKEEPLFDETHYAEMVSKKLGTNHHTFRLDNSDLFNELYNILDTLGEPFGDSSSIPMYILCGKARQYVKVSLSGDGGDELMGGYNKHLAEYRLRKSPYLKTFSNAVGPFLKLLPYSRNTVYGNKIRQIIRFSEGAKLSTADRYWEWASIANAHKAISLINTKNEKFEKLFSERKDTHLSTLDNNFNSLFYTDVKLVLQNDMLVKADLMSMANGLEVRVPFLDYRLVEFLFSLPFEYKIGSGYQKRILRDAVSHLIPQEVIQRKKQGFEVPLLKWFKTELKGSIESLWLDDDYIESQGIFDVQQIKILKKQLHSSNPQDIVAQIWGLIAFQHWYKRNIE